MAQLALPEWHFSKLYFKYPLRSKGQPVENSVSPVLRDSIGGRRQCWRLGPLLNEPSELQFRKIVRGSIRLGTIRPLVGPPHR
jgi:hypothetical protein